MLAKPRNLGRHHTLPIFRAGKVLTALSTRADGQSIIRGVSVSHHGPQTARTGSSVIHGPSLNPNGNQFYPHPLFSATDLDSSCRRKLLGDIILKNRGTRWRPLSSACFAQASRTNRPLGSHGQKHHATAASQSTREENVPRRDGSETP